MRTLFRNKSIWYLRSRRIPRNLASAKNKLMCNVWKTTGIWMGHKTARKLVRQMVRLRKAGKVMGDSERIRRHIEYLEKQKVHAVMFP